jgi:UDP-N-acetyl-D-galactosamine dehydrogenase
VDPEDARREYGLELAGWDDLRPADALVLAVAHNEVMKRPTADFVGKVVRGGCVIDVKSRLDVAAIRGAGLDIWRL